jgi:serine/threonine-protein kinase RsbW
MNLRAPEQDHAAEIAERLAIQRGVKLTEEARDLLVTQVQQDPGKIDAIVRRAAAESISLDDFPGVEHAYSEELFSGGIGAHFDGIIEAAAPTQEAAQKLISLLYDSISRETPLLPVAKWQKRLDLKVDEFDRLLNVLNVEELIRVTSNRVEVMREDLVFCDFIRARFRLELAGEDRAPVIADELAAYIKRAPELMARRYRAASSLDLRDLMAHFERRSVPAAFLDYMAFKEKYKGMPPDKVAAQLQSDGERIELPAIVFTAPTESFYPQLSAHIDTERSVVGVGFAKGTYREDDETTWLAAEIDSKLEVDKDLTEFWCDRLEAAALMCDFPNYKIWLIAPEGFTPEAMKVIARRNGFGSSRHQTKLLREFLVAEPAAAVESPGEEYEIAIPMGGDAELVAAHTLEDITRKHGFKSSDINKIKTALVEACINASEHSHSPDGQIRLSFHLAGSLMTITVANRGVRLSDQMPNEDAESEARRGWGLKLMERLMDDVRIEQTDDGTRISMSKLLEAA